MKDILRALVRGDELTSAQAEHAMRTVMQGEATDVQVAGFLAALAVRGETTAELTALTRVMREFLRPVACGDPHAIDLCGTGGDGHGTFNISTAAAFVCAGAGITVAKHGNVGVSSRCGSADVLRELGVNIDLGPTGVAACIEEVGIGFIFARHFHPAMRWVMPARKGLGVRTCFNMLGPLCNPAGVRRQVVGVFSAAGAWKVASILKSLGASHVVTVSSEGGLDEFSLVGPTTYYEVRRGWDAVATNTFAPAQYGLSEAPVSALRGGDTAENAALLKAILTGRRGPQRDVVVANSAFGLYVSGRFESLENCLAAAQHSLDSGAAAARLAQLQTASWRFA